MIGKVINKYRIDAKLGEGGMGIVYKAWDTVLERPVALKRLHPTLSQDEKFLKRFRAEGRALARLIHPNIVTVFDLEEVEQDLIIIMEYVEGMTLAEKLKQNRLLLFETTLPIIKQILTALGYAHHAGVIHRDIKPGNVMLTLPGYIKLTDFGLAKIHTDQHLTQSSFTAGTLCYMPPEQLKSLADVDRRSDIYAIGMTFYEMLAGRLPFEKSENIYTLPRIIIEGKFTCPDHFNPDVPRELSKIVMKAIAREPVKRYQSAEEMLAAIAQFEAGRTPTRTLLLPKPALTKKFGRGRVIAFLALLALVLISLFGLLPSERLRKFYDNQTLATLSVSTLPAGATLFLNGDSVGVTPIEAYSITAGTLSLRLKKQDYVVFDTTIAITSDRGATLSFFLKPIITVMPLETEQPEPPVIVFGALRIASQPSGAGIFINDQPRGKTPRLIKDLAPGKFSIVLKEAGYQDYSISADLKAGEEQKITATLIQFMGKLRVVARPSGAIDIDGARQRENAPELFETTLPVGPHLVKVTHPTFGYWEKQVDVKTDSLTPIQIDFEKIVKITVVTAGAKWATIYIDGKTTSLQTPSVVTLRVGKHTIEVRREGYILEGGVKEINIENDLKEPLSFTLKRLPQ